MSERPLHPTPEQSTRRDRLPALDGVRGLAILLVLVNNLYPEHPSTGIDAVVEAVSNLWWVGVDLFFVLSGFLITGILTDTRGDTHYYRAFYARRALRILPLYYGVVLMLVVLCRLGVLGPAEASEHFLARQWWFWAHLVNVMMVHVGPGAAAFGTAHFWSLAVEEQFYLAWPLVVARTGVRGLARLCAGLLVVALVLRAAWLAVGRDDVGVYLLTPTHADGILVGALVALAARSPVWWPRVARAARLAFAAGAPLALCLVAWGHVGGTGDVVAHTIGFSCVALSCGALLVLALARPAESRTGRLFRHPALRFFGVYSYGIYVWSGLVEASVRRTVPLTTALPTLWGSRIPSALVVLLAESAIATGLAYVTWHAYERPFLRLKRYFRYDGARPVDAARERVVAPRDVIVGTEMSRRIETRL